MRTKSQVKSPCLALFYIPIWPREDSKDKWAYY